MVIGHKPFALPRYGSLSRVSSHARFAEAMAQRYVAHSCGSQGRVSLILARRWTSQTILLRHGLRRASMLTPHIHLHVRTDQITAVVKKLGSPDLHRTVGAVLEHAHVRSRRVEIDPADTLMHGRRPQMFVVRRLAAPGVARDDAIVSAEPAHPRTRLADQSNARNAAPSVAPVIDVARLTEQVIDGIDRRIIAQRERFGRF